jgi:hypothetical protein
MIPQKNCGVNETTVIRIWMRNEKESAFHLDLRKVSSNNMDGEVKPPT